MIRNQATIMMLTYNRLEFTKQTLHSIFETTTYPFSLIIIDNASKDGTVEFLHTYLEEKLGNEKFFRGYTLHVNKKNLGVIVARNQALTIAPGEWLVTMDNDVMLPKEWLTECIEILQANRSMGICGVNFEDVQYPVVKEHGKEFQYKPDGQLGAACTVFHRKIHEELGFFNTEYGLYGNEDVDFCLRARISGYELCFIKENGTHLSEIKKDAVDYVAFKNAGYKRNELRIKINFFLYHLGLKSLYVSEGISKKERLTDVRPKQKKSESPKGVLKVGTYSFIGYVVITSACRYLAQKIRTTRFKKRAASIVEQVRPSELSTKEVTIVIPFRDKKMLLEKCVESILAKTTYENYNILLITNQSNEEETFEYLKKISANPHIEIVTYDKLFDYGAIHNWAMNSVRTEYVVFLDYNTDVISPEWLTDLMRWMGDKNVGVAGALLRYVDGVQHAGIDVYPNSIINVNQYVPYSAENKAFIDAQEVPAVSGTCFVTRKSLYQEVNGMQQGIKTTKYTLQDIDYCLKVRKAGYQIIFEPRAQLFHYEPHYRELTWTSYERYANYTKDMKSFWKKWTPFILKTY